MDPRFETDRSGLGKISLTPHFRTTGHQPAIGYELGKRSAWDREAFRIDYKRASRTLKRHGETATSNTREETKSVILATSKNIRLHVASHLLHTGGAVRASARGLDFAGQRGGVVDDLERRIDPAASRITLKLAT